MLQQRARDARAKIMHDRAIAAQEVRIEQQGQGRPIISAQLAGQRIVFVGDRALHSPSWKTFPDFLWSYLKLVMGADWLEQELRKPEANRSPIWHWHEAVVSQRRKLSVAEGDFVEAELTGAAACYLSLSQSLYQLEHNVTLQARYLQRLRDVRNFQGAYYELQVACALIRAGFRLELMDDVGRGPSTCEFTATSTRTGRSFDVEAKSRAIAGFLGKDHTDGGSDERVGDKVWDHLHAALKKHGEKPKIIFIDLNAPIIAETANWQEGAVAEVHRYGERFRDKSAYVVLTNLANHRYPDEGLRPGLSVAYTTIGYGDPRRFSRLFDAYQWRKRHIDLHYAAEGFSEILRFPVTFDGSMLSETGLAGTPGRLLIGENYIFGGGADAVSGELIDATVIETERVASLIVRTSDGKTVLIRAPLSAAELSDYRRHRDV